MAKTSFAKIDWQARSVQIEYHWINAELTSRPLLVFLHEGLGSTAMWRDYPQQLCNVLEMRGLVYSRPGYGQSTPRGKNEQWAPNFMHQQAFEVMPALFKALGIYEKPWLLGHSDGGSIALLHASQYSVAGLIVLSPHIMVEDLSILSIEKAREAYVNTNLRQRLSRYHADVDSAFGGWSQIWLNPDFRNWSIEEEIKTIDCPVLAVQGVDDEYGTMAQIKGIAQRLGQTQLVEINACGHSPHRDQPQKLNDICLRFFKIHQNSSTDLTHQ